MKLAENVLEELWFAEDDSGDETEEASNSMAAKLAEVQGLKTFPVVAQKVLGILSRPEFRVIEVTSALEEDPALAAGVLRMANSAFFAGSKACSSIDQAFVRLGARSVQETVGAVATMDMFPDKGGLGKLIRDHCAATAAIVQALTRDFASKYTDGIFLAGLMHDVAKMLLMESGEIIYSTGNTQETLEPDKIHILERSILGYDHAVLGGHVLQSWNLPDPIPKIVAWHHHRSRAYEDTNMGPRVAMLAIADHLEALLRHPTIDNEKHLTELAQGTDCSYMGITSDDLESRWENLYQIRADAFKLFGCQ
ncbi:MAG: HDOD domain-containing protein [Proteobacteria bacterium]|nr:HDOD domain-containing protein [Pseudomonadota bacterium]